MYYCSSHIFSLFAHLKWLKVRHLRALGSLRKYQNVSRCCNSLEYVVWLSYMNLNMQNIFASKSFRKSKSNPKTYCWYHILYICSGSFFHNSASQFKSSQLKHEQKDKKTQCLQCCLRRSAVHTKFTNMACLSYVNVCVIRGENRWLYKTING